MGGWGSGRWAGYSDRRTTEDLPSLDVRELRREGRVSDGQESIAVTDGLETRISWNSAGFSGSQDGHYLRPWFVCPAEAGGCGRRAAILYLDGLPDSPRLLCRVCLDLAYPSQRERELSRARRKAEKLRERLGPHPEAGKPKGMHHKTFVRLGLEYLAAVEAQRVLYDRWCATLLETKTGGPSRSDELAGVDALLDGD